MLIDRRDAPWICREVDGVRDKESEEVDERALDFDWRRGEGGAGRLEVREDEERFEGGIAG